MPQNAPNFQNRTILYPYKMGSASARLLAAELDALRVRVDGRYRPRRGDVVINWGNGNVPTWWDALTAVGGRILNAPRNVAIAANKLHTFRTLQEAGVATPEFTTDRGIANVASNWRDFDPENDVIYARHKLTGHSGDGIEVIAPRQELPRAPLYVKGIENHGEYRVHVFNDRVIDYIKKRRRNGEQPTEAQSAVRSLANGWVYTRQNLRRLERVEQLAIQAVAALGLDFGAVDIIKDEEGDVFVLEVNTACGLGDTTLESYLTAFNNSIHA